MAVWQLAREIRPKADNVKSVRAEVKAWYEDQRRDGWPSWTEVWARFARCWQKVLLSGDKDFATSARRWMDEISPDELPAEVGDLSPAAKRLAALCLALHKQHKGRPWPLACRKAAEIAGDLTHQQTAELLHLFTVEGIIEIATPAKKGARRAARYRWIAQASEPSDFRTLPIDDEEIPI